LGIGLSLVRTLVSMHGGRVDAHSDGVGRGSEFIVRLPVEKRTAHEQQRAADNGRSMPADVHRILVVDDNRDSADTLAMLLKSLGADVHTAYDGASALESIRICRPTIVLLDLGLPGIDGYEVARRVRSDAPTSELCMVALTGWGQDEDRRRTREAGFDHHLVKPVDLSALQALLASLENARGSTSMTVAQS
jgi:CheY-like chemotaxis protein